MKLIITESQLENLYESGELTTSPYNVDMIRNDWRKVYKFKTEDMDEYEVNLHEMDEGENNWYMSFAVKGPSDVDYSNNIIVNKGRVYRVMSTIGKVLKGFIYNHHPESIQFEADERRLSLYSIYIKKNLPMNYKIQVNSKEMVIKKRD